MPHRWTELVHASSCLYVHSQKLIEDNAMMWANYSIFLCHQPCISTFRLPLCYPGGLRNAKYYIFYFYNLNLSENNVLQRYLTFNCMKPLKLVIRKLTAVNTAHRRDSAPICQRCKSCGKSNHLPHSCKWPLYTTLLIRAKL